MSAMPGSASTKVKVLPQMRIPVRAGAARYYTTGSLRSTGQAAGYADPQAGYGVPASGTITGTAAEHGIPTGSTITYGSSSRSAAA